ncbi:MAG: M48 family metalloprotease [Gammaproteobacteria bacterium]
MSAVRKLISALRLRCLTCIVLALALILQCAYAATVLNDPRSSASFYVETYGLVDPGENARVARAHRIFRRLARVAGTTANRSPGLRVVSSEAEPWAIALPGGYVILSQGALDVCYRGVTVEQGDARLAFVIGHELAHLTGNDFLHRDIYMSLSGAAEPALDRVKQLVGNTGANASAAWQETLRRTELEADDTGFLYASLAGYDTSLLLTQENGGFLEHWVQQTRTDNDDVHLRPAERTSFLRKRLENLQSKAGLFAAGVRLAHFGRFEDARYFLREFQAVFPSREVFSNLGYVHLQMARRLLDPTVAYRYWMPSLLETETRLGANTRGVARRLSPAARRELEFAVDMLETAAKSDPRHVVSRFNLVAAYMYLGEFHKARAVIEEARELRPEDPQVLGMRALVLTEQDREIDMWPTAVGILESLVGRPAPQANVVFNLARLLEERGRKDQSLLYWGRLRTRLEELPAPYREIVCRKTGEPCDAATAVRLRERLRQQIPVPAGADIDTETSRRQLQHWRRDSLRLGPVVTDMFSAPNGDSLVAIDHHVELIVLTEQPFNTVRQLTDCCGEPLIRMPAAHGEIWSYGPDASALVDGGVVREIWLASR